VDLSKLLLENAVCIPSLENVDNVILPHHHPYGDVVHSLYSYGFNSAP